MTQTSLIKNLSLQWDLRMGPFRAFFPSEKGTINRCLDMIGLTGLNGSSSKPSQDYLFAACQDNISSEMVACLHLEDALEIAQSTERKEQYNIKLLHEDLLESTVVLSQISFHFSTQQAAIAQILLSHCFIEVLKAGGQAIITACDIGYFSMYKRFGMRPIGPLRKSPNGNYFIPMIFIPDEDYLSLINSPVLNLLRGVNFPNYKSTCLWYYQLLKENSELQTGSVFYPENQEEFEGHHALTEGLSDQGKEAFLKNAMVNKCREGEVLITENDGGKSFGFIQKGIVKVVIGSKTVVMLGEGDIFGEIAYILNSKRTAQVIAASPDTEIVLFSDSAIQNLDDEEDRMIIWRNLARVLAQRVVLTNKLLV